MTLVELSESDRETDDETGSETDSDHYSLETDGETGRGTF